MGEDPRHAAAMEEDDGLVSGMGPARTPSINAAIAFPV